MLATNFGKALKAAGLNNTIAAGPQFFNPQNPGKDVLHGTFDPTKPYDGSNASFQARYGFSPVTEKGPVSGGDGSSLQTIKDAIGLGYLSDIIDPNYDPFNDPEGQLQTRMDMLIVQGTRPGPNNFPLNVFNDLLLLILSHSGGNGGNGGTTGDSTHLLLLGHRFSVTVTFIDPRTSKVGPGQAVALAADTTGAFWFFDSANLELMIKVINGQAVNGHFWVYYGALSDVDYTITVTDTKTGAKKTYHNPKGTLASHGDVNAFPAP
jgi:hypothetical protein